MVALREDENLARYLYHKSQYRTSDSSVRHNAYMPPKDKKLSVFRTDGLNEMEIWNLGDTLRPESPIARGDLVVSEVLEMKLAVIPDDQPPRHANIVGWPEEEPDILNRAIEMSQKATLHERSRLT